MADKRNALIDVTRVIAAAGIILCHVDMAIYGPVGELLGQFLSVRASLMFFLAIIGFYVEKAYLTGRKPVCKRVRSLVKVYSMWSLAYMALSFIMLVLIQKIPLAEYLLSRVKGFLFSGSYYHFWFYPAVIYALLIIAGMKKLLGQQALRVMLPIAVVLYAIGLLGTGYLPLGQQIPVLNALYTSSEFENIMHLFLLGFPSIVFGMAAAHGGKAFSSRVLALAAVAYVAESVMLCLLLGWRENPQMLLSTPFLTILFLQWLQQSPLTLLRVTPQLLRTVSAGMYNIHPLLLACFAIVLPGLTGLPAFLVCTACSALFGWVLYRLRYIRLFALFT